MQAKSELKTMKNNKTPGHIAMFIANVFFGLNITISRSLTPDFVHPLVLGFFRMSGAMILFWIVSLFAKKEQVQSKDLLLLFFASIFALSYNQTAFITGLSKTSPIDASIIQIMLPIVSMILAFFFMKEPITWKKALGVSIGLGGVLILILNNSKTQSGESNLLGNLILFSAIISFSLYLTLFKNLIAKYSSVTLMKWMFLFATIISIPVCWKPLSNTDFNSFTPDVYLRIGYVVVFATFITYLLIPVGQKVLRPTTISMYNYVQPIVASLVAVIIGMDQFGIDKIISGILVFIGVYFVTTSKSKAQLDAEKEKTPVPKSEI